MMTYSDGSEILVGDTVFFGKERTSGMIAVVISEELADWNVEEPGVMIKSATLGMVFIARSKFSCVQITFEQRGKYNHLWNGP